MPTLAQYDPRAVAVKNTEINRQRDAIEISPLEVNGFLLDVDEKSDRRMAEAIELGPSLGVTEYSWTLADNTQHTFTVAELSGVYQAMRVQRAARSQQLHSDAIAFKTNGATQRDMLNWVASYANSVG